MKHFWKKLKWFLLAFILYFILGFLLVNVNNNAAWGFYTLGLFIGFPVYFFWIIFSEVKYRLNIKKQINLNVNSNSYSSEPKSKVSSSSLYESIQSSLSQSESVLRSIQSSKDKSLSISKSIAEQSESLSLSQSSSLISSVHDSVSESIINSETINTDIPGISIKTALSYRSSGKHGRNYAKALPDITVHHLRRKLYNFVVVDTETTGLEKDARIIQLSAIRYEHDKPVEEFNKYINPGTLPLSSKITTITGINNEQLESAPSFDNVVNEFMTFVGTLPWIGHNINKFDIPRLVSNGLPLTEVSTIDTLKLAKNKLHMAHYSLEELKHYYGIQNKSHDALEDCKTNAIVYQRLRDDILTPVQPDYSDIQQTLTGLNFAISGTFSGYSRKDVEELIKSHGGKVKSTVTHDTDYLVDGTQISDNLTDGVHSAKELKARDYGTKVMSLSELNKMIGG